MLYTEIPTQRPVTPLLDGIDHPQQLRQLEQGLLPQVADELRQYILYAMMSAVRSVILQESMRLLCY